MIKVGRKRCRDNRATFIKAYKIKRPTEFLDFCSKFSNDVTPIDDYPLDEWTIFVRR